MILDELSHAALYRNLGPHFAAGFDFLAAARLDDLPDGRHPISGEDVVAVVQTYLTKPPEGARWEAHRHHADIQVLLRGTENIGVAPVKSMRLRPPYNQENDVEFYEGGGQTFQLNPGGFAIFLPQDVHMPGLAIDSPVQVRKVVIKIRLN